GFDEERMALGYLQLRGYSGKRLARRERELRRHSRRDRWLGWPCTELDPRDRVDPGHQWRERIDGHRSRRHRRNRWDRRQWRQRRPRRQRRADPYSMSNSVQLMDELTVHDHDGRHRRLRNGG